MFKGKKMAGHMGDERVTTQNLKIVKTDADRGLIMVEGAVPGAKGGWILVRDAVKRALPDGAPKPGAIRKCEPPLRPAPAEAAAAAGSAGTPSRGPSDGSQGHQPRRQGGRFGHAAGRDFRSRAARRHSAAHGPLSVRPSVRPARTGPRRGARSRPRRAKMYKQKGTGRARHGAKTAPQFRGGGRAFGPVVREPCASTCRRRCGRWR